MAEPRRVYPFDAYACAASASASAPGVTITARQVASMLNFRGDAHRVGPGCRIALPLEPNTASDTAAGRALWLGPDEWLLVSESVTPNLAADMGDITVTDVSHGRALLRVSGPDVRAALAKGCPLDLHPRAFAVGRCAQTAIAKISVILDHVEPGVFDLYCSRSYAGSFWHWLTEACAEYHYTVVAPA